MEYQRDEHRVHLINYHLIWTPKRRKKVLVGQVAVRLEDLLHATCEKNGWSILELAVQPDHVHLFVRVWPTTSAEEVVKACKGATSKVLRSEFPELRKLPSLWTRSYFASTAGNISSETIKKYIEMQKTY